MPVHPSVWARLKRQQRSYWPDGHIRIGDSVPAGRGVRPVKLATFRFSSPSKAMIEAAADLYGGQVVPMTRGYDSWQVITTASAVPVLLPEDPVSQWMELWDGPYCLRRCDGATTELKSGQPCLCLATRQQRCTIHTRLSVYLQDVPSLGLWMLVTKGKNAAQDLPGRAEFAGHAGPYLDAFLTIREGRTLENGKPAVYYVPRIVVEGISPRQVMAGTVPERRQALARRNTPELTAAAAVPQEVDYIARAVAAKTAQEVRAIWTAAEQADALTPQLRTVLSALGAARARQEDASTPPGAPADSGERKPTRDGGDQAPADQDERAEQLREQIIRGWRGTLPALHEAFSCATGTTLRRADHQQLVDFLAELHRGEPDVVEAVVVDDLNDSDDA